MINVFASSPVLMGLWALLWCRVDSVSCGCEGVWVPCRSECAGTCPPARLALSSSLLLTALWGSGLRLRVTEAVISQHYWFLLCLPCSILPWGLLLGQWWQGQPQSEEALGSQCPGLGAAHPAPVPAAGCSAFQRCNHNPGLYICAHGTGFYSVFPCVTNSNAEWNTVKSMCSCKIYTVLALIMVFVPLPAHAKRNTQNWYPWYKAGVHKILIKLKCNLNFSLVLL